jgi:hypothetical protein
MKQLAIDVTNLTAGARELVREFIRQYETIKPEEISGENTKTICIRGRYRYAAASDAFWAIAGCGEYPHLDWSMQGVQFTLNSQIPNTVGIYKPADAPQIMSENAMGIALLICNIALLLGAVFVMAASKSGAIAAPTAAEILCGLVVTEFCTVFGIAPCLAFEVACRIYKR